MPSAELADGSSASAPVEFDHLPMAWEPTPVRPRLPLGVAVVAILIAVLGIVLVLSSLLFLLVLLGGPILSPSLEIVSSINWFGAAILLVFGAALIGIATALWDQEPWALWTTVVLLFGTIAYLFFTGYVTVLFVLLVILFVYLLAVRRYFY